LQRRISSPATFHPTAGWVLQQLREAFPYDTAPKYLIFDRDTIFSCAVVKFVKAMGTKPVRISYRSPWQNGTAERWIGSCQSRAPRIVRSYVTYYHEDRCHLGLEKDPPNKRLVTRRPSPAAKVVAIPKVGGLHHRYEWREAA
jgi:putative transposase